MKIPVINIKETLKLFFSPCALLSHFIPLFLRPLLCSDIPPVPLFPLLYPPVFPFLSLALSLSLSLSLSLPSIKSRCISRHLHFQSPGWLSLLIMHLILLAQQLRVIKICDSDKYQLNRILINVAITVPLH